VERKGSVAYRLALPDSLNHMHDVVHVSVLRNYVSDPTHVIDMSSLQVSDKSALVAEPIRILNHRINIYNVEQSIRSRSSGTIIVHTRLPGRTHMIYVSCFLTYLID
jgi:hypothetical protein